jgi:hypothetical protein
VHLKLAAIAGKQRFSSLMPGIQDSLMTFPCRLIAAINALTAFHSGGTLLTPKAIDCSVTLD